MDTDYTTLLLPTKVPELLGKILENLHEQALVQLKEEGEVMPVIMAFSPQENAKVKVFVYPVGSLMNSSNNKEIIRMMMEETIQKDEVTIVLLITEAWLLKLPAKNVTKKEVLQIRPSEHPDKEEVVLVNIMTKTEQLIANAKIYRDPVSLDKFDLVSLTGESEGTLVRDEEDTPKIH